MRPRQGTRGALCASTRVASSRRTSWRPSRERLRFHPQEPFPQEAARRPDDRLDPGGLRHLRRARVVRVGVQLQPGQRSGRSTDRGQQDQYVAAVAGVLFQPGRRAQRRAPGDSHQLVRRLLPGSEELPRRLRRRAGELHEALRQRLHLSASGARSLHSRAGRLAGRRAHDGQMGVEGRDVIPLSSSIYSKRDGSHVWDVKIVGTFAGRTPQNDSNVMLIQYDYFDEARSYQKDLIGWIALRTASPELNDRVAKTIDATFANSPDETTTDTEKAFTRAFSAQFGNIALMVGLVVGAAFVTILMIVGNTMALTIRERTREIGALKTLGISGGRILRMVLGESVLLALIGGVPGLALAAAAIFAVRDSVMQFVPTLTMPPVVMAAALALMLALGILTGLFPALSAMRLKIATALGRS